VTLRAFVWLVIGALVQGLLVAGIVAWRSDWQSSPGPLLAAGGITALLVFVITGIGTIVYTATRKAIARRSEREPGWTFLTYSLPTGLFLLFGALFFAIFGLGCLIGAFYGGGWLAACCAVLFFFCAARCWQSAFFALFQDLRWNEEIIEIRTTLRPLRTIRFSQIISAGVWPVVGHVGFQTEDGYRFRFSHHCWGSPAFYRRLRETMGQRFKGRSLMLDNALADWDIENSIRDDGR